MWDRKRRRTVREFQNIRLFFSLAKGNLFSLPCGNKFTSRFSSASGGFLWISKLVLHDWKRGPLQVLRWHFYLRTHASCFDGAWAIIYRCFRLASCGTGFLEWMQTDQKLCKYTEINHLFHNVPGRSYFGRYCYPLGAMEVFISVVHAF
jgi:hypothetical protein